MPAKPHISVSFLFWGQTNPEEVMATGGPKHTGLAEGHGSGWK
jgi:hypothetical protein